MTAEEPVQPTPGADEPAPAVAHAVGIVVWDTPSPAVVGRPVRVRAGLACEAGCDLAGQVIQVVGADGAAVGACALREVLETQSGRLFWADVDLPTPTGPGVSRLTARFDGCELEHEHLPAEQEFSFAADIEPDCTVQVRVIREETGEPCGEVEVRLGRYEVYTDAEGEARLHVPKGRYVATTRRLGLKGEPVEVSVDGDLALELVTQKGETREELEARLSRMEDRPWA
jgi:hypothetical protein